jgi:hypothetical protein
VVKGLDPRGIEFYCGFLRDSYLGDGIAPRPSLSDEASRSSSQSWLGRSMRWLMSDDAEPQWHCRSHYSFKISINILLASLGSARPLERFITSPTSLMTGFSFPFRIVVATSAKSPITLLQVSPRSPVGEVSRPNSFKILARVAEGEGLAMICLIIDFPVVPTHQLEVCCWFDSLPFMTFSSRDSIISLIRLEGMIDWVHFVSDFPS